MRITIRLVIALALAAGVVVAGSTWLQMASERSRLLNDLQHRSAVLAESVDVIADPATFSQDPATIWKYVKALSRRGNTNGVAICDLQGKVLAGSPNLAAQAPLIKPLAIRAIAADAPLTQVSRFAGSDWQVYVRPLHSNDDIQRVTGALVLVQDLAFIQDRVGEVWHHNFLRLLLQVFLLSLVTLWIVRWTVLTPIDQLAGWMRRARSGAVDGLQTPAGLPDHLVAEAAQLARSLAAARAAAEDEARLRETAQALWTPERLKEHVRQRLGGRPLFVVSNREPYMHVRAGKKLETIMPAAGLVTALDPVLRACGGTWIAHGAGDGDWAVVDDKDRLRVPEDNPRYVLRRVALSREEEDGYYYGFSNQGLWPLSLMTHQRPVFREEDWKRYQEVNAKFAEIALEELTGVESPCVLIQDYQFALLPRLIKSRRPDARVALFWHIPWPHSEAFSICPWQEQLLQGLLGADLVGFHTQLFCNNFLETVDRTLESRVDWESFSVGKDSHRTTVKPFPVGVCYPQVFPDAPAAEVPPKEKGELLRELGLRAPLLGIGVERIDYTKGLLERFRAIERLFEKHPEHIGRFAYVELGAPSRTHIKSYHDFMAQVSAEADRINWRFQRKDWRPITLLQRHHSHREILPYYRAADVCLVTSLHDGMNLVAKEFVAARADEAGTLILSRFAGASDELRDALIVNPYDIERMADALFEALEMPREEQGLRMRRMRQSVREHNIYGWAGSLIGELARLRLDDAAGARAA